MTDTLVVHDGAGGMGGAERTVVELCKALDADLYVGYSAIGREWFDRRCPNDVTVAGIGDNIPQLRDALVAARIATTTFEEYDTVVTSGPPAKYYQPYETQEHYHYLHHTNLRDVFWNEGSIKSYILGAIDRFEAATIPHLIANSQLTEKATHVQYNRDVDAVVNPPVDVHRFDHTQTRADGQFVMLGRLTERKRPRLAVDAFTQLAGDAELIVLGDGPLRDELERTAPKNVDVRGYVDDDEATTVLNQSDGAVMLGKMEPFGITTAEYLAAGTPVVAVDEPNTNNIISDENGVLVEADPTAVARGARTLMAQDWDRDAIADEAQQYSTRRFREAVVEIIDEGSTCKY